MEFLHHLSENISSFALEYGLLGLAIFSFTEAFINPVPVSPVLMLAVSNGTPTLPAFFIVLIFNLLGAIVGFWLGKHLGHPVAIKIFGEKKIDKAEAFFAKWGAFGIVLMAFTPLPYKVACWAAGIFEMRFPSFFLASVFGRTAHFLVALAIVYFGWKAAGILIGV